MTTFRKINDREYAYGDYNYIKVCALNGKGTISDVEIRVARKGQALYINSAHLEYLKSDFVKFIFPEKTKIYILGTCAEFNSHYKVNGNEIKIQQFI